MSAPPPAVTVVLKVNGGRNRMVAYFPGGIGNLTSSGIVPGVAAAAGEAGADVTVPAAGLVAAALPEPPELHPVKIHTASTATAAGVAIVHRFIGPLLRVGFCCYTGQARQGGYTPSSTGVPGFCAEQRPAQRTCLA